MTAARYYRACSGQSSRRAFGHGSDYDWGICLDYSVYNLMPWWRARTSDGKQRKFRTYEGAERAARRLEAQGLPAELLERMQAAEESAHG